MFISTTPSPARGPNNIGNSVRLRSAYDYWLGCGDADRLPGRQHIDPVEIPSLLPDLMLLDWEGGYYRCRLAGTRIAEHLGQELTGRIFSQDVLGNAFDTWIPALEEVRRSGRPDSTQELCWKGREHHPFQFLCLPLARDGQHVDKLMLVFEWL